MQAGRVVHDTDRQRAAPRIRLKALTETPVMLRPASDRSRRVRPPGGDVAPAGRQRGDRSANPRRSPRARDGDTFDGAARAHCQAHDSSGRSRRRRPQAADSDRCRHFLSQPRPGGDHDSAQAAAAATPSHPGEPSMSPLVATGADGHREDRGEAPGAAGRDATPTRRIPWTRPANPRPVRAACRPR